MTIEIQSQVAGNGAGPVSTTTPQATADGRVERRSYARIPTVLEAPNLVQIQLDSFQWFLREGLQELFTEISPIQDYNQKSMDLSFPRYEFQEPRHAVDVCRERDQTYAAPLYVPPRCWSRKPARSRRARSTWASSR